MLNTSKIESFRSNKKLSQLEFANKIGITPNGYQKIIKHGKTSSDTLEGIAKAMAVHPGELFTEPYTPTNQPHTFEEDEGAYTLPASNREVTQLIDHYKDLVSTLKNQVEYFENLYRKELEANMALRQAK